MPFSRSVRRTFGASRGAPELTELALNLSRWVSAGRPRTLPLAAAPVLAGVTLAATETGNLDLITAAATLLAAVAIQVGTNLHNDAADFERGTDTEHRVGPLRATAQGWFTAGQVKRAAHVAFLTALLLGIYLCIRGGWPILLLGLGSLAAGYAYTSGPRPIAYGPFGELFVLLFFGIAAVAGSHYLQTLAFSWTSVALGFALGLPASAVLLLNNYRDLETDRIAGRRTLCHYLGRRRTRFAYTVLLSAPFPILVFGDFPGSTWPVLAALPFAAHLISRIFQGATGTALNPLLGSTALFQASLAVLLMIGFILPAGA
jgi:1,4-dihydroxy-2-naphthoate octaprenyltransferase